MSRIPLLQLVHLAVVCALIPFSAVAADPRPNVLLIVCDDLNDYVETLGGHPQVRTPHLRRLIESGVSFTQAHCNIPICNPSRASFVSGLYPHTSRLFGFEHWDKNEVLRHSRTMMKHFSAHGYHTLGTGKVMHNRDRREWDEFGYPSDYGPFGWSGGKEHLPHPDTPAPFRDDFGAIDGSFGPLRNLEGETDAEGKPWRWRTGGWGKQREFRYVSDADRDPTGDELNARWAVKRLRELAAEEDRKPFFMGVGFVRPHTPLIVPQKYFDRFPLDTIQLPVIREGDVEDTFKHTVTSAEDDRSGDRGTMLHDSLVASFGGDRELALKKFVQAYLASVASVDDLVGEVLDVLEDVGLAEETVVVFTSDHGWGNGEKGYLYKNSLWQESTRVPLVVRAPGVSKAGSTTDAAVSLVDLYPTFLDLCGVPDDTVSGAKGRRLDGHSLKPLLVDPGEGEWGGPDAVLTAMYKWAKSYDPATQNYSLRSNDWRYIRYENGKEELYHCAEDPHEWSNLALNADYAEELALWRQKLLARLPEPEPRGEPTDEEWKAGYFAKNPDADANKDGKLTWPELQSHRKKGEANQPASAPVSERLQTKGMFSKTGTEGPVIFTDGADGTRYYVIDSLHEKVAGRLEKEVTVVARVKDARSGPVRLMVHLVSIE